ncbi:hypothetical protein [Motilibacter aurantiacus]|uniref:hypothetical protein n=1 Tax=Motilibacter aurantiacus TaxID=2714955 RepID=UPI00140C7A13|nr:hypothetical protein [Motilibacter aurantiacus]NHC44252.1 hypothetical protein [Motilibacter aurantiacus]
MSDRPDRARNRRAVLALAPAVLLGALVPSPASAAAPALTTQLLTAADLPGFTVAVKPQREGLDDFTEAGPCALDVPARSVAASTVLDTSTTSKDKRRTTSLSVTETALRMPSAEAAAAVFEQMRRVLPDCLRAVPGDEDDAEAARMSVRVGAARAVEGSSAGFRVDAHLSSTVREDGTRFTSRQALRQTYYLAGTTIVSLTTSRSVSVVREKSISISGTLGPVVKRVAGQAAEAAVAKVAG